MTSNDELRAKAEAARACVCGKLWGLHNKLGPQFMVCLCRATLSRLPLGDEQWYLQHGPNPEHRSPVYEGGGLLTACDWVDSVCLFDRAGEA